jgi:type IV pilus assembly protein PilQ
MKTQPFPFWVFLAGALALSVGQGCAQNDALIEPIATEPTATSQAEAPAAEKSAPVAPVEAEAAARPAEPAAEPRPVVPTPPVQAAHAPTETVPAKALGPAKTITAIDVHRQDEGLVVLITGDGELNYQVVKLDGNRLILDLSGVVNGTKRHAIPVGHQLVRQIRIGTHQLPQPKLRLVLDLERSVPYSIDKTGPQLKVTLSERTVQAGALEAAATVRSGSAIVQKPATDNSRRNAPTVPIPERLKLLDPLPAFAQPKTGETGDTGAAAATERFTGKRISLDFQDAEISSVLRLIADVSGLNMVVGEAVKAKVTLKLLNVPWDQALDLILKLNNLGQLREGNILWVDTLTNITKLRDDAAKAREATLKAEELMTRIIYLNYADASKSVDVAKSNLSPRGDIKIDSRTNSLVVRDISDNLGKVEQIVRELDQRTPQVQIEARIVQATRNFAKGLGVQWGLGGISNTDNNTTAAEAPFSGPCCFTQGHNQGPVTVNLGASSTSAAFAQASDFLVNLPAQGVTASTFGLLIGKFLGTTGVLDLRLSAGESMSLTKTLSSPKVITLDNKPAKIESGQQIPYQTTSLQGTQTTFVDATLALNVTPHIVPHAKTIRLEIKITRNFPGEATAAGAAINKNEATTEVLLNNGETTVIGGIFTEDKSDTTAGVPWFNRIPFLGWLFKRENTINNTSELLVFVTPTILAD